jgi:hypothetical protein
MSPPRPACPPAIVWDLETGIAAPSEANVNALRRVFENAGVEFIEGGVKVRKWK